MRVIKKKKGNKEFYYLQHSFRKQDKVVTKEKYLGKEIPKNIEELEIFFLKDCHKLSLFILFEKIKQNFQKEWEKYPKSIKEKFKEQITIDFTYNTNAIEGSTISLEETRELVEHKIAPNKPLRDIKETGAHVSVFLKMLNEKEPISIKQILEWHRELFADTKKDIAGRFREYPVRVGNYRAPDWQNIKGLMKELIKFYNKNKRMNPVELAARTHYKFEKIHPFGDGNGRIGRLLMNNILWHNQYPILIIEYKKRKSYYRALGENENNFFNYFSRRYLKANEKYWRKTAKK